jgi:hypothetical protein
VQQSSRDESGREASSSFSEEKEPKEHFVLWVWGVGIGTPLGTRGRFSNISKNAASLFRQDWDSQKP